MVESLFEWFKEEKRVLFKLEGWNIVIRGLKITGILFYGDGIMNCVLGLYILNKFGLGSNWYWIGLCVDGVREF